MRDSDLENVELLEEASFCSLQGYFQTLCPGLLPDLLQAIKARDEEQGPATGREMGSQLLEEGENGIPSGRSAIQCRVEPARAPLRLTGGEIGRIEDHQIEPGLDSSKEIRPHHLKSLAFDPSCGMRTDICGHNGLDLRSKLSADQPGAAADLYSHVFRPGLLQGHSLEKAGILSRRVDLTWDWVGHGTSSISRTLALPSLRAGPWAGGFLR